MSENFSENQPEIITGMQAEDAGAETELLDAEAREIAEMRKQAKWYVVHTYSGYENKVKDTLEKSIKSNGMQDFIFEVRVPVEEVTEIRKGKRVKSQRKVFPGYVIVKMIKTNESWYVVRNTRGVTGFVGPDGQPVALTEDEIEMMLNPQSNGTETDLAIGETVRIVDGSFANFKGTIKEIDQMLGKVLVDVQTFANRTSEQWINMEDVMKEEEE